MSKLQLKLAKQLKMQVTQLTKGLNRSSQDLELQCKLSSRLCQGLSQVEKSLRLLFLRFPSINLKMKTCQSKITKTITYFKCLHWTN